jgi:hypothetical protein
MFAMEDQDESGKPSDLLESPARQRAEPAGIIGPLPMVRVSSAAAPPPTTPPVRGIGAQPQAGPGLARIGGVQGQGLVGDLGDR